MNEEESLIAELKAKHGKVYTITIPLDEDDETKVLTYHLRKPSLQDRKMIEKTLFGPNSDKAVFVAYNLLRVGGDEVKELEKYEDAQISANMAITEFMQVQRATIKKN